jgi:DNA-binding IclR family transcriptional regulator
MSDHNELQRYQIAVVHRALDVIELLARQSVPMGASEVASELDIPRNAAFRLLATLASRGYVEQDPESRKYRLGLRLFQVGNAVYAALDIRRLAFPILEELRNRFQETVNLALLDGHEILYVERIESERSLRTATAIGSRAPLYCTALGKAILAYSPALQPATGGNLGPLERLTENTITDPEALQAELDSVRDEGYAVDCEEHMVGVRCIAAPIFDSRGKPCSALSLSGPTQRMAEQTTKGEVIAAVREAARQLSQQMGYSSKIEPGTSGL